ncbi:uncharacterized protein LOC143659822 isoform X2 [Tamandua tetradactyla]|uniref:uncharacterized protein LOC143659822 isoform X2 n=1 Tax=Tamandua tetradactyla TaxID=48850 RepID=UPI0040549AB1
MRAAACVVASYVTLDRLPRGPGPLPQLGLAPEGADEAAVGCRRGVLVDLAPVERPQIRVDRELMATFSASFPSLVPQARVECVPLGGPASGIPLCTGR